MEITAPLPGNIMKVNISVGETIKKGHVMFVLEAMKMENDVVAPKDATVTGVYVKVGNVVNTGSKMATLG